jgi:hypothetical protein
MGAVSMNGGPPSFFPKLANTRMGFDLHSSMYAVKQGLLGIIRGVPQQRDLMQLELLVRLPECPYQQVRAQYNQCCRTAHPNVSAQSVPYTSRTKLSASTMSPPSSDTCSG